MGNSSHLWTCSKFIQWICSVLVLLMALIGWGFSAFRITIQLRWLSRFLRDLLICMIKRVLIKILIKKKMLHVFSYPFYCTHCNFPMEKAISGGAVDSALARINNKWSRFRDLLYPLTSSGLLLESKVDYIFLACITLFYIRVNFGLLKRKIWSN